MAQTTQGWLVKQGHIFKTWKKRWFVLEPPLLKYYKTADDDHTQPELRQLKGCITLLNCAVCALPAADADGRPFAFQLTPMSRKVFFICAADDHERDAWIAAIQASSTLKRAGSSAASAAEADADALDDATDPRSVRNQVSGADGSVALGDFELLKVIGRGTYGKVMQVRLKTTREVLAMKVLKKESVFSRNDPKDLQHTIAERNVLALLNSHEHPFILGLRYAFHTPSKLYYVLSYCNGGDLYNLLSRCKKFKEAHARFYAGQVFLAIRHLHSIGVIYRDLKPENVLLDEGGHVKLTDFGLSKESTTADTFCGTPVYLAPEIWMRKTYGYEVDWWSLGCVLYEMVCGMPPFWGDSIKDVYKKVLNTQPKYPTMTAECKAIIEGLLQRDAARRLGNRDNGADIESHAFFEPQSWGDLLARKIKPPYKSKGTIEDTGNFHSMFTQQRPIDSLANSSHLNDEQQANFEGFTYVPKSAVAEAEDAPMASPARAPETGDNVSRAGS